MVFLPDAGVSPEILMMNGNVFRHLNKSEELEILQFCDVNLSVSKFDCKCNMSFVAGMERMVVTDVLRVEGFVLSRNVSAMTTLYVSDIGQTARLVMDEEGIEATSIIVAPLFGAIKPDEEIDFTPDRLFLMAILGEDDVPVFIGAIFTTDVP